VTDDEIRDAAKIIEQRAMGKGMLPMSEERKALLNSLLYDIELYLINKNGRSRGEIVEAIERELKV
jgi:hypothetical protein